MNIEKQKLFIIPDLHGSYYELTEMVKLVPEDTKILFLGDYIDRGDNSLTTLRIVMDLVKSNKAYALMGNHEFMFLDWLNSSSNLNGYIDGGFDGLTTVNDFISSLDLKEDLDLDSKKMYIKELFKEEIDFIKNLNLFITMDNNLFVHAGIEPHTTDLSNIDADTALWIRDKFHTSKHSLPYRVFFGHTPIKYILGGKVSGIWYSTDKKKFGLDGGCVFKSGNKLNGVLLNPDTDYLEIYQTYKDYKFYYNNLIKTKKLPNINL